MSLQSRLGIAFVGGCTVALALSLIAAFLIHVVDDRRDEDMIEAHPVDLLLGYDQLDLKELLGEPRYQLPEVREAPELPTYRPPEREIRGFVMLAVEVDAEGRTIDAQVLEAEPSGVFETEAITQALAERWPAGSPGMRDHVVQFTIPGGERSARSLSD
ncbi:MAG: energy transducer TonB [Pseudomonadota bacterium]